MNVFNPSSTKKVAICIFNKEVFYNQNFSILPFLTVSDNSVLVYTPSFDFLTSPVKQAIQTFAQDPKNYVFGGVNNFLISPIDYYKAVNTFTYSDFTSQKKMDSIRTEGSLVIPMVIPYNQNVSFSKFLESLWRISVFNFVPFFLYTDASPKNIGGPLFSEKFNISVSGGESVKINLKFKGGTSIRPPDAIVNSADTIFPFPTNYNPLDPSTTFVYRTAQSYDCFFYIPTPVNATKDSDIYNTYSNVNGFYSNKNSVNIQSMSLDITQNIKMLWSASPGGGNASNTTKNGVKNTLIDGVKYIGMEKRTVTGKISFISSSDLSLMYRGSKIQQFVMYFGGPFYYPMNNVNVQLFSAELLSEEFYVHEIEFIALLQPSPNKEYYKQGEFDIDYTVLFNPITGAVNTKSQND